MSVQEGIHVGDVGTSFQRQIKDWNTGVIVDISDATDMTIYFWKPSAPATVVSKAASLLTDGKDGLLHYISEVDFLDEEGWWKWQAWVTKPGGLWHTDIDTFVVLPNLA